MSKNQYNDFAQEYSVLEKENNTESKFCYYAQFDMPLKDKRLLDMGCGDGVDFSFYFHKEALVYGVDESSEMVKLARKNFPQAQLKVENFEAVPYADDYFDVVCSKWAYQHLSQLESLYKEVHRILKPGGYFLYLTKHPLRQFMEKKKKEKNYFQKEMVHSTFFQGRITSLEPSHTFNEYFSPFFLRHFEILSFEEQIESAAEMVENCIYPGFFIVKATKKRLTHAPGQNP